MEYKEIANSWRESFQNGDIDEALKNIEIQIATNFMFVHNQLCAEKFSSPVEVMIRSDYGETVYDQYKEIMERILDVKFLFEAAGHGLDFGSTLPKEYVLKRFEEVEEKLRSEMVSFE